MGAGHTEGKAEGERGVVRRLLSRRFGPLAPEGEALLDAAEPERLERWADRLLTVATLDEVFA